MPITPRHLGAVPSAPDHRDFTFAPTAAVDVLPKSYQLSNQQPIRDQGQEGTCVGHAVASGLLGFFESRSGWNRTLSTRDAYAGARSLESPPPTEGTSIRDALLYAQKTGLCLEADWPYVAGQVGQPGTNAAADRPLNKVAGFAALAQDGIKAALVHQAAPVVICIPVTNPFFSPDSSGRVSYAGPVVGYHAVTVVGYDDAQQAYRLRNSWGASWGQGGYCWYPYTLPITEAWTATATITNAAPAPAKPWWAFLFPWLT